MWKKSKPAAQPVNSSNQRISGQSAGAEEPQLSGENGVDSTVSSGALARALLALGVHPSAEVAGGLSDAEMMLRVKAGDDSAFDYLVQKYRRPMIGFMYRMARNTSAAEDLA